MRKIKSKEEFKQLLKSAKKNPKDAKEIAEIYKKGDKELGIDIDYEKAIKYYTISSKVDNYSYHSLYLLYDFYMPNKLSYKQMAKKNLEKYVEYCRTLKYVSGSEIVHLANFYFPT